MSNKTPDKFTLFVPDEQEAERELPDHLEIEADYMATTVVLPAGAYDPYEKPKGDKTPERSTKKQDLRKLSEWIKLKREVEELARANEAPDPGKKS